MHRSAVLGLLSLAACRDPDHVAPRLASSGTAASHAPVPAPGAVGCEGLEKHACVLQPGCILDQTARRDVVCRAARDTCEASVRHADLLGPTRSLPGVTLESQQRAEATCRAQRECTVTSGSCSCACGVMDDCKCECGGAYLARCVRSEDAAKLEGLVR